MNNGYNDVWGRGTKWSCQNQIKSNQNQNQIKNQIRNKTLSWNPFQTRFQAIYELIYFGISVVNVIFSVSKMNSLLQEKSTTNRFVICSTCERCLLVFLLTTGPGHVSVSTKDITVNFDDSHCGSSPIAVTVECWCCPTVRLCVPTPHKPTTFFIDKDWVQIRKQYLQVLVVIKTSKYGGQTEAWGGKRKGKITVGQINETKALIGCDAFES